MAWSQRTEEFTKRAGFVLMAVLAVHDKKATDRQFEAFLKQIRKAAADDRSFVKKAVSWALRQIGKRNPALNRKAIAVAGDIQRLESSAARWVANDALRELRNKKIQQRFSQRAAR
jgi:3-methyladenine DNA glycosylase AlkD